jgi:hypothetical protein
MTKPQPLSMTRAGTVALFIVVLVVAAALGWLGWKWRHTVQLKTIVIEGNTHVPSKALHELIAIEGDTLLFDIEPADVVERLKDVPWVATASVHRRPTGTLAVRVTEREPVVVLMRDGRPWLYLDRYGSSMAVATGKPVDVPVVHGAAADDDLQAGAQIADDRVLELLDVVARLDDASYDLISEVLVARSGLSLFTTPLPGGPSIRVLLGSGGFAEKLRRLEVFWSRVMLTRPGDGIREIDLRFDGQIITS